MNQISTIIKGQHFYTFEVHRGEYILHEGRYYGLTYEIIDTYTCSGAKQFDDLYNQYTDEGYVDWVKFCKDNNRTCLLYDLGDYLL